MKDSHIRGRMLIVDDEVLFCDALRAFFEPSGVSVTAVHSVAEARATCLDTAFDVVLLDNILPDGSGLSLTPDIMRVFDRTKIVLVTGHPSFENAVEAIKTGVHDYVSKPVDFHELRLAIEQALRAGELERVEQVERYRAERESSETVLVGSTRPFTETVDLVRKAAESSASVLITGETGTGKTMIAQAIHYGGGRRSGPFLPINCAAIPEGLIESELFGAEKGAYTGATSSRKGTFELAEAGTLFLDEIAEMPVALQVKLLSVLEDRKVRRVGGQVSREVDVRVIAATNLQPERAIAEGRFRSDLYYRLGVLRIHVPPLREHAGDVRGLCEHFLRQLAPGRRVAVADSELAVLERYPWPGNVRELKNLIERSLILQDGPTLRPSAFLPAGVDVGDPVPDATPAPPARSRRLEDVERAHILGVYEACKHNLARTSTDLDISLSTLKRKLREYGAR